MCVEECPTKSWEWYSQYSRELADSADTDGRDDMICKESVNLQTTSKVGTYIFLRIDHTAAAAANNRQPQFIAQFVCDVTA